MQSPPLFTSLVPPLQQRIEWHSTICSLSLGQESSVWELGHQSGGQRELFPVQWVVSYFISKKIFLPQVLPPHNEFEKVTWDTGVETSPQSCIALMVSEWWTYIGHAGKIPLLCLARNMYLVTAAGPALIFPGCSITMLLHEEILLKSCNTFLFPFRRRSWRWTTSYVHQGVHLWHPLAVSSPGSADGCNPDRAPCPFPRK